MLFDLPLLTPHFVIRGFSMTRFEYTPRSHNATSENTQFDERPEFIFRLPRSAVVVLQPMNLALASSHRRPSAPSDTRQRTSRPRNCKYARQQSVDFKSARAVAD